MLQFQSRRSDVLARHGMVATSQPLAAQAGLSIMQAGGNAVDAAVATAAVLAVVEPMSTGLGGDVFALLWDSQTKQMRAMNGSGRAAAAADPLVLKQRGHKIMPIDGEDVVYSITVPGTVDAWATLLENGGSMTFKEVLQPAINYAKQGFPVSDIIAQAWQQAAVKLRAYPSGQELLVNGHAPHCGDVVTLPQLARSLECVQSEGKAAFYQGELATKMIAYIQEHHGWLTLEDLHNHQSTWETPLSTDYRDVTVWQCPPNTQGLATLLALNIAEGFDFEMFEPQSAKRYHYLIEAMRLAFADALHYVADPVQQQQPIADLLSKGYAWQRRKLIRSYQAMSTVHYGTPLPAGGTVYVSSVDQHGNACSLINSTYHPFGSGLVVPETGISLHNRGAGFVLDPEHPNYLQANKRPYHTIMPGMATRHEDFWLSFGVMGAYQQPQGHLQVLSNLIDYTMPPQAALDALRFSIDLDSCVVRLEHGVDAKIVNELQKYGHQVKVLEGYERVSFGGGQVIARNPDTGVLWGGSEPRKDGAAVGF